MSRETLGLLLGLMGVTMFGATLPMTFITVAEIDVVFVTAFRAAASGLLAGAVLVLAGRTLPPRAAWLRLCVASVGLVFGFPAFTGLAMQSVPAAHGGVVLGIMPLMTAAIGAIAVGERPSGRFWFFAVLGTITVVGFALRDGGGRLVLGDLFLALAAISAPSGYVASGDLAKTMPGWEVISWALVIALPWSIPITLLTWPADLAGVSTPGWIGLAYITFISQYLAFFAWNKGLAMGGIARVGQVQLLQTFITLVFAALLTGETIDALTWLAAVLVVAIVMMGRKATIRNA